MIVYAASQEDRKPKECAEDEQQQQQIRSDSTRDEELRGVIQSVTAAPPPFASCSFLASASSCLRR